MQISVNRTLCEANGVCTSIAPHLFELDEDDELQVRIPSQGDLERVLDAIESCPKNALALQE